MSRDRAAARWKWRRGRLAAFALVLSAAGAANGVAQQSASPPGGHGEPPAAAADTARGDGIIAGDIIVTPSGRPLPYATVILEPGARERFADAGGAFFIGNLPAGRYHLRVRQIGFAPVDTTVSVDAHPPASGSLPRLRIALRVVAIQLPRVVVQGEQSACLTPGVPDSTVDPSLADLFAEVEKNVDRYQLLIDEYPFAFTREEWRVWRNDAGYEQTVSLDTVRYEAKQMESEARAYKPGAVVTWESDSYGDRHQKLPLPTFRYLGDPEFQRTHCFEYVGPDTSGGALPTIRVDFRPAASIRTPDLEGSVYLDQSRYIVRRAVFRLTEPNRVVPPISELSVTTTFREIVPLVPVFDEVRYRQPVYKTGTAAWLEVDRLLGFRFEHGAPGRQ